MAYFASIDYKLPIEIDRLKCIRSSYVFDLELGGSLPEIGIAYHTYGRLNAAGDNVIWICHALTANSDVANWWPKMVGEGMLFDSKKYFIVCANILGSCYGTSGPRSLNPNTGQAYGLDFPKLTVRDQVKAHRLLGKRLGVKKIKWCVGGSGGGYQVLEFASLYPDYIDQLFVAVASARETAWNIAIHEGQRLALEADPEFFKNRDDAGRAGLRAARAMALVNYRTYGSYISQQSATDERTEDLPAASYVKYQGEKLVKRFYAHSYSVLLSALDTHHLGRGRGGVENALRAINHPSLIMGIDSDRLIPPVEQKLLAEQMPNARLEIIHSNYGHDGFLIETRKIKQIFERSDLWPETNIYM